jgi:hypothetical protein
MPQYSIAESISTLLDLYVGDARVFQIVRLSLLGKVRFRSVSSQSGVLLVLALVILCFDYSY